MRLSSILLAVSAATLLACGSALPAAADANQNTKASAVTSPGLGVLDVSLNAGDAKRSLRGLKTVGEEDEERLAGANMFSDAKLLKAMTDAKYAKQLMRRWKSHGVEIKNAKFRLNKSAYANDKRLNAVYLRYAAWLDTHFPLGAETTGGRNLFHPANLKKALKDDVYAKSLFRKWQAHQYESTGILAKLKAVGLKEPEYSALYKNYMAWFKLHHPDEATLALSRGTGLFKESMLLEALRNDEYAERLFWAWKAKRYNVAKKLENKLGNVNNRMLNKYNAWLDKNFPKTKPTAS